MRSCTRAIMGDDEAHMPLQAVLLADSFMQKFRPITMERPKVLLPLVNVPMIDYTLEWLASAGVEEVFVVCCAHAKQVKSYLEKSDWQSQPNFKVTAIESHDCVSVGDALRLVDQRNLVRSDFVLISGDTVSNMSLKEVLHEHKERRKSDKLAVMTMVVKRSKPSAVTHQTRLGNDELILAIDTQTKQLVYYDDGVSGGGSQRSLSSQIVLDRSIYFDRPSVCLCNNLQDCYIDICAPEVLLLFTDNFDYQHLRRDFLKGLLSDEITGNKVFTYEISGEYAARVDNLRSYNAVSEDIICRWTYPIVPDIGFTGNSIGLKVERCNVYKENGVKLPRTAHIGPATVLGEGTSVRDGCVIRNSVIGRGCSIGENVVIEGSYLWNNVTVQENVHIQFAVICDGCVVKSGAVIEPGAVLSFNVVIGQNYVVKRYSKISLIPQPTEEGSSDEELEYVEAATLNSERPLEAVQGEKGFSDDCASVPDVYKKDACHELEIGAGYIWSVKDGSQDEEWKHSIAPIPVEKLEEMRARKDEVDLEDSNKDVNVVVDTENISVSEDEGIKDEEHEATDLVAFDKEVEETFKRAVLEGVSQANVIIEVNSLRLAYVTSFKDCAGAIFKAIMNYALEQPHTTPAELFANTKNAINRWKALLENYLKTEDDQVEVLLNFEEMCLESGKEFATMFCTVLRMLYDEDIVSEDAIMAWANEKQNADDADKIFLRQCGPFIKWLEEASEEDD